MIYLSMNVIYVAKYRHKKYTTINDLINYNLEWIILWDLFFHELCIPKYDENINGIVQFIRKYLFKKKYNKVIIL